MPCSYCTAANMGRVHGEGDVGEIVDEIAALVASARAKGLPVLPLFLAADEVNLPDERLLERVLRELLARDLAKSLHWRGYFNPTPFSDELCETDRGDERHGLDDGRLVIVTTCSREMASPSAAGTWTSRWSGSWDTGSRSSSD